MKKITPFLWYDNNASEAMAFYQSAFTKAGVTSSAVPSAGGGYVLGDLEVFTINGGPMFKFTPSTSLFVICSSEHEIDTLYNELIAGGTVMMALSAYPFSEKFGWINDKYGLSWQFSLDTKEKPTQKVTPFLMFVGPQAGQVQNAIDLYSSVFKNSSTQVTAHYEAGEGDKEEYIKHARFMLEGQQIMAMESGGPHHFTFTEAFSLYINCETQDEIDYFWNKLTEGGTESRCGWLKDRFGVSWQVIPSILPKYLNDPDKDKAQRTLQAMMSMSKISIDALEKAYQGSY